VEGRRGEHRIDGLLERQRQEVGLPHVDGGRQQRARLLDHGRRGVDRDHVPAREAGIQLLRDLARAAAGVEHRLVAFQLEPVEHLDAHSGDRVREAFVGGGVPVARLRHGRTLSRTHVCWRPRPSLPAR
jgi:hypothetical protein